MSRSLKYEIPGEDWRCTPTEVCNLGWHGLFSGELPPGFDRVLEIGFGRGEFLLDLASERRHTAFIGVEVSYKRVLKMARKLAASQLRNVRLLEARGQMVVKHFLPRASVDEIWVNFSDPWPKDRHAGRRLIQPDFVADATRCLRPGGVLQVATDDVAYAQQIDTVLAGERGLRNSNAPQPWLAEVSGRRETGYEADWRREGRPLHFFTYRRPSSAAAVRARSALPPQP